MNKTYFLEIESINLITLHPYVNCKCRGIVNLTFIWKLFWKVKIIIPMSLIFEKIFTGWKLSKGYVSKSFFILHNLTWKIISIQFVQDLSSHLFTYGPKGGSSYFSGEGGKIITSSLFFRSMPPPWFIMLGWGKFFFQGGSTFIP